MIGAALLSAPSGSMTPRSSYSAKNEERLRAMVNVLMQLDESGMTKIRKAFERHGWELNCYEFVKIMQCNMAMSTGTFQEMDALCEMFREIDVNGDNTMEWEVTAAFILPHLRRSQCGVWLVPLRRSSLGTWSSLPTFTIKTMAA